jgi:hypothetical protein
MGVRAALGGRGHAPFASGPRACPAKGRIPNDLRNISRPQGKNFSTICIASVYARFPGRDANDARLQRAQSATLSTSSPNWSGACLCPLLNIPARAEDQPDETEKGPQPGDHLVFLSGPKKDQPARVEDLELGGEQLQTYPADPKSLSENIMRDCIVFAA